MPSGPDRDPALVRREIADLEARLHRLRRELDALESPRVDSPPPAPPMPAGAPRPPTNAALASTTPASPVATNDLERFVGGRVIAVIGALVLAVGLGALAHLAYRQGWFATFGVAGRMGIGYLLSAGLIAAGELAMRRAGRPAAIGFTAAGVAGLYITTDVGIELGKAMEPTAAMAVAVGILLVGALLTLRLAALPVAIISVLGAYAAPAFGMGFRSPPLLTALHLTACLALTLGLAARQPRHFWTLRFVALPIHAFAALVWLFGTAWDEPILSLVFVIAWWGMELGEAGLAALRGTTPRANVVIAFLATVVAAGFVAPVLGETMPATNLIAYAPVAMALAAFAGSFLLPDLDPADAATDEERAIVVASSLYRATLRLVGILMGALSLAPFVGAAALAIAWSATVVGVAEAGRRRLLAGASWLAFVLLLLAGVAAFAAGVASRLAGGAWFELAEGAILPGFGAFRLTPGGTSFLAAAAAGIVAGLRRRPDGEPPIAFLIPSLVFWPLACLLSGERWMLVLLLLLGTMALAAVVLLRRDQRDRLALATTVSAIMTLFAWTVGKMGGVAGIQEPAPLGVDLVLAMATLGVAFAVAAAAGRPAVRIACQVLGALLAGWVAVVIGEQDLGRWTGAGPDELLGAVAAAVAVTAMILQLYANAFGARPIAVASSVQIIAATALWAVGSVTVPAIRDPLGAAAPILNRDVAIGLLLAAATAIAFRSERRATSDTASAVTRPLLLALPANLWAIPVLLVSREAARGIAMMDPHLVAPGLSLLWGASAIALVVVGFARRNRVARWIGLATLGLVAIKVVVWDMRTADTLLRVVVMLVVGTIMVLTSILYVRRSQGPGRRGDPSATGNETAS